MRVTPLAITSNAAVREALARRGFDDDRADAAARGVSPAAVLVDGVDAALRDALQRAAARQPIACLTGEGWVLLAATAAELAGLARWAAEAVPGPLAAELAAAVQGALAPPEAWITARGAIPLERPVVVGIVNVTPDSFSDGGRYLKPTAALRHADQLVAAGADALDVGAESTRPGRPDPVDAAEEWRRLAPVLDGLARHHPTVPVSVDTVKAETARRALDAGAWAVNDVSALRHDPALAEVCATAGAGLILMHSRGGLAAMATYDHAAYHEFVPEVVTELRAAADRARAAGVAASSVVLDPGFGFAKRPEQNYELLDQLGAITALGYPVMVGPSRKRFLGAMSGKPPAERDAATAAACVVARLAGVHLFRVHDAAGAREALDVVHAARTAGTGAAVGAEG
ncbi:MAG TPA: dihydropteroate synthase [Gemmatimonadales bacterium]|nr:dihydropteroate synthase [Gemmatimonadales bacterium]